MWSGWNGQSCWVRKVDEFDWRVFFVNGGVWVIPSDGGEGTYIHMSWRRGWLMSKENMDSESAESDEEDAKKNQNRCRWVRHDDCWLKS